MDSTTNVEDNDVNGTGTACEGASSSKCPVKWTKTVNVAMTECHYRSKPFDEDGKPVRG